MTEKINPEDFIITRKRKLYRFARFANADNCFEYDEWLNSKLLNRLKNINLEVGAGTGLFSLELAALNPKNNYVALDVKADRLQKGAHEASERGITNIYFLRARADQICDLFEAHSLAAIWLTFADPFPRKSNAGRRMTNPTFLQKYAEVLLPDGTFYLKHDNDNFFHWSLEQLVNNKWHIDEICFDLHESDLKDEYKILTTFEKRWVGDGRKTKFAKAVKL